LKKTPKLQMLTFVALTYRTGAHKILESEAIMWRVEISSETVERLVHALMPSAMYQFQDHRSAD
jgi:hypothetical protein